jgi:hypothetical protein
MPVGGTALVMSSDAYSETFLRNGWFRFDLCGREHLQEIRRDLLALLRTEYPSLPSLEAYHRFVLDDDEHFRVQEMLFDHYVRRGLGPAIVESNVDVFRGLIGSDLDVQAQPYLRIARPGKPQDNVNVHRDTHYGGTPYELSVHIPFTDCGLLGSLGVISGSHVEADGAYPYEQINNEAVKRGSVRHKLGFTYAPKRLRAADIEKVEPTGTTLGQALVFSLSIVHGQVVNRSEVTRFSTDIRVVNALAPVDCERIKRSGYYRPLCRSAVTMAAEAYYEADARFLRTS